MKTLKTAVSVVLLLASTGFAQSLSVSPSSLTFSAVQGGASPPSQTLRLTLYGAGPVFSVFRPLNSTTTVPIPSWLGTIPTSIPTDASESATIQVTVNPTGLALGTYAVRVYFYSSNPNYAGDSANIILAVTSSTFPLPNIANVTNAAIPALDNPPATISLPARSMATIFGTNLADATLSSTSPWSTALGGTEVHLVGDTCFDPSCDLVVGLIYVSPTQINFLVPSNGVTTPSPCVGLCDVNTPYRIVFVRDGQRVDNQSYILGGPGRLVITSLSETTFQVGQSGDYDVVFQVGYDCLFSYSLTDPASCGLSWSQGQNRAPLGAMTDAVSGVLISSQAPVHQGQLITLWMTGLYSGVTLNTKTGLMTANTPTAIGFGVAQLGQDEFSTLGCPYECGGGFGLIGTFMTPLPLWAGESPQFVGLDQVNVAFPTCTNKPPATTEKRYDAFLTYNIHDPTYGIPVSRVRIYLPFVVRPGDPDCQW